MTEYSEPVGETWKYNPEYHRVSDFLGLDVHERQEYGNAQKVSLIRDWAGLHGKNNSVEEVLTHLHETKKGLGIPYSGKQLVNDLYQHVRLDLDTRAQAHKNPTVPRLAKKKQPTKSVPLKKMIQQSVKETIQLAIKDAFK